MKASLFNAPLEVARLHFVVPIQQERYKADGARVEKGKERAGASRNPRKRHRGEDEGRKAEDSCRSDRPTPRRTRAGHFCGQ